MRHLTQKHETSIEINHNSQKMSYHLKKEYLEKWMSVLNRDSDDLDEQVRTRI